jgi:hypothetical protein
LYSAARWSSHLVLVNVGLAGSIDGHLAFQGLHREKGWMKATMPAEEESNGIAGTVFVGNSTNAASGVAAWNCTGTTAAGGGTAGDIVEDGDATTTDVVEDSGAATTVESTATTPYCNTGSTTRSSVDEGGAAGVLPLMMSSSARMRSSFTSSLASKATGSNGVPDMIVDALVEVSDTKLIRND